MSLFKDWFLSNWSPSKGRKWLIVNRFPKTNCLDFNIIFQVFSDYENHHCNYSQPIVSFLQPLCLAQCGNCKLFVSLKFFVKSNLAILGSQKLPFWAFSTFANVEFHQNSKLRTFKTVTIAVFELLTLPNLISRKI